MISVIVPLRGEDPGAAARFSSVAAVRDDELGVAMVFLRGQIQNIFSNIGNNLT